MIAALYHTLDRHPGAARWLGMLSSVTATGFSFMEQLEIVLRIISLLVGISIGVLTLLITWRKWRAGQD